MLGLTDTEVALSMRYTREVDDTVRHAQAIVDRKNADIAMLQAQLAATQAALRTMTARALAAEMKVDRLNAILDTPLN